MKLGIGTAQFGFDYGATNHNGKIAKNEIRNILACAKENGIETLDTAPCYGDSETTLGDIGVDNWDRKSVV